MEFEERVKTLEHKVFCMENILEEDMGSANNFEVILKLLVEEGLNKEIKDQLEPFYKLLNDVIIRLEKLEQK